MWTAVSKLESAETFRVLFDKNQVQAFLMVTGYCQLFNSDFVTEEIPHGSIPD